MILPPGKVPTAILREVVFRNLGAPRREVVVGPSIGLDGAVLDFGNKSLIVSMDPVTGATERVGWLAVNVNANDVATFGVEPAFLFSCIMLPENEERELVETISTQMSEAARNLGIAIVGGHCESTPGLTNPIIVGCTLGIAEKGQYVTADKARPGDKIILTKSAGIEGTAILATDREQELRRSLDATILQNAKNLYSKISVVSDALTAFKTGGVHAMHDPTEGGIANGIHELADASNIGVTIYESEIPVRLETLRICEFFKIDPLQLISSGALLISATPGSEENIIQELQKQEIPGSVVGEVSSDAEERRLVKRTGEAVELPRPPSDHLWTALKRRASP